MAKGNLTSVSIVFQPQTWHRHWDKSPTGPYPRAWIRNILTRGRQPLLEPGRIRELRRPGTPWRTLIARQPRRSDSDSRNASVHRGDGKLFLPDISSKSKHFVYYVVKRLVADLIALDYVLVNYTSASNRTCCKYDPGTTRISWPNYANSQRSVHPVYRAVSIYLWFTPSFSN